MSNIRIVLWSNRRELGAKSCDQRRSRTTRWTQRRLEKWGKLGTVAAVATDDDCNDGDCDDCDDGGDDDGDADEKTLVSWASR